MTIDKKMPTAPAWRDPLSLCFETHRRFLELRLRQRQRAIARRQAAGYTRAWSGTPQ
jgi:hypothetical protein